MDIRSAIISDAQRFQSYFSDIVEENLPTLFHRDKAPTVEDWEKFIERHVSSSDCLFLIAEHDNKIIGALNFSNYVKPQRSHCGDITVTVANQWRSKGVGTSLTKSLITWIDDHNYISRIELEVFSNNQHAIGLYAKLGFNHEGVKRKAVLVNDKLIDIIQMAWIKPT